MPLLVEADSLQNFQCLVIDTLLLCVTLITLQRTAVGLLVTAILTSRLRAWLRTISLEQIERDSAHHEKIKRSNAASVIVQECLPTLGGQPLTLGHVPRHG